VTFSSGYFQFLARGYGPSVVIFTENRRQACCLFQTHGCPFGRSVLFGEFALSAAATRCISPLHLIEPGSVDASLPPLKAVCLAPRLTAFSFFVEGTAVPFLQDFVFLFRCASDSGSAPRTTFPPLALSLRAECLFSRRADLCQFLSLFSVRAQSLPFFFYRLCYLRSS